MEGLDIVDYFVESVVGQAMWGLLCHLVHEGDLLINCDELFLALHDIGTHHLHHDLASVEELGISNLSILMLTEDDMLVFLADSNEVLDKVDGLEKGVLLPSEHHCDEIVLFMELLVALFFEGAANDDSIFCFRRGLFFPKL